MAPSAYSPSCINLEHGSAGILPDATEICGCEQLDPEDVQSALLRLSVECLWASPYWRKECQMPVALFLYFL